MDLRTDHHVHTAFSVGSATVDENVRAAEQAGLTGLVILDRADPGADWLPAHAGAVRRAAARTPLRLARGIEVAVLDTAGRLALPADLSAVDYLAVTETGFPLRAGPASASDVRVLLSTGVMTAPQLAELLVKALVAGLRQAADIAQPVLTKPLATLAEVRLAGAASDPAGGSVEATAEVLPATLLSTLAEGCLGAGALVEVNEKHRCPGVGVAVALAAAGVPLAAGSSARHPAEVGRWSYLAEVAGAVTASG